MLSLLILSISVLLGYALGGRLSCLPGLRLRWLPLVYTALMIQLLIFPVLSENALLPWAVEPLHLLSYALLAAWIIRHLDRLPVVLLGAGAAANLAALLINGGRMPASANALQQAGLVEASARLLQDGTYANVVLMSAETRWNVLGDWLFLPAWIPLSTAFSIGDVLIMLALGWLIVKGMRSHA
jgi:hypothetical protein